MADNQKTVSANGMAVLLLVLANVIFIREGYANDEKWYSCLIITLPVLIWMIIDIRRGKRATESADLKNHTSLSYEDQSGNTEENLINPPDALQPAAE